MNVRYSHAAALDIGKRATVCMLHTPRHRETRPFAMTTQSLLTLADWLNEHGVTHVALESTGVYWKPIFNLLEGYDFELLLVNPREFRSVPGRKTDVRDAEWLCDLLRHGRLKASFVPPKHQRELRELVRYRLVRYRLVRYRLVRYRRKLIEERTREYNRLEKVLEGANIKLGAVASTMTGKSVREMLWALAHGESDPEALAVMARGRLREKHTQLVEALEGFMGPHQRFMLREQLGHLDELDGRIERISREVAERLGPFEAQLRALETIPGVGRRTAEELVAEIGFDMSRFPTSRPLARWAKLCPGTNASAGKRGSGRTGHGNRYLRTALVEAAHATARRKGSYLHAQYHRLAARQEARGRGGGTFDLGHSVLFAPRWGRL